MYTQVAAGTRAPSHVPDRVLRVRYQPLVFATDPPHPTFTNPRTNHAAAQKPRTCTHECSPAHVRACAGWLVLYSFTTGLAKEWPHSERNKLDIQWVPLAHVMCAHAIIRVFTIISSIIRRYYLKQLARVVSAPVRICACARSYARVPTVGKSVPQKCVRACTCLFLGDCEVCTRAGASERVSECCEGTLCAGDRSRSLG